MSTMKSLAVVVALAAACHGLAVARPNVVLVMTDDQGYGDFSIHGNPILKTPNMDQLASESIRFSDFHVAPACTPTRGQLLTGLDALRNGANSPHGQFFLLKRGLQTMGEVFRENGYRTALYGKWHLGGNFAGFMPHERGFDDAVHFLRGGVQSMPNVWNSDLFDDTSLHNGRLETFEGYATDVWFDLGIEFVKRSQATGDPFFLYLPLNAPHAPLMVQDCYREPYLDLPKETATFFGMIAGVDDRLGQFLRFLAESDLEDDTILIFLTDNGTAYGEKVFGAGMRGKKGSLYEGGHRVPLWVRWPGGRLLPPTTMSELVHVQDLLPTLIELCSLESERKVDYDGVSLAPLLRGAAMPVLSERMLVVQSSHIRGDAAVMWNKWRLVKEELYDIESDPGQTTSVAAKHPEIVRGLSDHYSSWWSGVAGLLEAEPFSLGPDPVMLTAYDWWGGPRVYNWPHLRRGDRGCGKYAVSVEEPGRYMVSLRRWPRESGLGITSGAPRYVPPDRFTAFDETIENFPPGKALDIVGARVRFGSEVKTLEVGAADQEVRFAFDLEAGPNELQAWFRDRAGEEFGAYYVYVEKR